MKKIATWCKYALIYSAGFLTSFSGALESLVKIPASYSELKKTYLYDTDFLSGHWSTNAEYLLNNGDSGLDINQPKMILNFDVSDDGSVKGEILSKEICDALPITYVIILESGEPGIRDFFFDRKFYLEQLHEGKMQAVAVLKLVKKDKKNSAIKFKVVGGGSFLPKEITFGKNLPQYKDDFKVLSDYCAESPEKFWKEYFLKQGKSFK
ncbi:hypothetical protein [Pantoea cypripedii]|jgi:hypothetical protein|uniref:Uncharacterized protein n=1 Tax=Pantoea cypripedii TaxID=55209 RepID=A0A6B9G4X1_PANCY|nr:hypothetical protein [Pantoea cypripedii]QGY30070.1 hypothetical protein CUN67_14490 [Pantoea cypripedii]